MTDKTDAWMPLWIGAYLADTQMLTTLQHGAYLLLLMAYWRERAALPDDDDALRSIAKADRAEWKKLRPTLVRFFKITDGVWWHKRVEAEIASADKRQAAAVLKAKNAAGKRWGIPSGSAPSMPEALPEDVLEECPTPSPSSLRSEKPPSGVQGATKPSKRCPADFKPDGWDAMQAKCPGVSIARETEKFRDWEFKRATSDWQAAWRRWMRKAFDDLQAKPTGETNYAREMREKYEQVAPLVAATKPGQVRPNPLDVIEGMTREPIRIAR